MLKECLGCLLSKYEVVPANVADPASLCVYMRSMPMSVRGPMSHRRRGGMRKPQSRPDKRA